jgi:hypothetical protein
VYKRQRLKDVKPNAKGKRPHVPTIRRFVLESRGGLVFSKFPASEINLEPIPDQLDPDIPVATDPRWTLHKHDRVIPGRFNRLALVQRGDGLKTVPAQWVKKKRNKKTGKWKRERVYGCEYSMELAERHVDRARGDDYDPDTGKGDHRGENVKGWHRHAPRTAKYFNVGDNRRTDFGPAGLKPWRQAKEGIGHLEGKKKHIACEAAGWPAVCSWLSISMVTKREVEAHADWLRANNPSIVLFVGCDADWMDFPRNRGAVFRQAMYTQTLYRERGIEAYMVSPPVSGVGTKCRCDPKSLLAHNLAHNGFERIFDPPLGGAKLGGYCPYCGGYFKGHDEWYGAGGTTGDLFVTDRQPPYARISEFVLGLPLHKNAKPGRARALRGLSLHGWNQALGVNLLDVPLKTLQKIMNARRPQDVPAILKDLAGALEIPGSLEIEKREYLDDELKTRVVWDWVKRPRFHVKPEFQAQEQFITHSEFWRTRQVTTEEYIELSNRVSVVERRLDERDHFEATDAIAGLEAMLAENAEHEVA